MFTIYVSYSFYKLNIAIKSNRLLDICPANSLESCWHLSSPHA